MAEAPISSTRPCVDWPRRHAQPKQPGKHNTKRKPAHVSEVRDATISLRQEGCLGELRCKPKHQQNRNSMAGGSSQHGSDSRRVHRPLDRAERERAEQACDRTARPDEGYDAVRRGEVVCVCGNDS